MASQDTKEDPYVYFSNVPSSMAIQDPREEPSNNHYVIPSVVISIDSSVFPSSIPSSSSASNILSYKPIEYLLVQFYGNPSIVPSDLHSHLPSSEISDTFEA